MPLSQNSANPRAPICLIIGHVVPYPPYSGNQLRIEKLVRWLKVSGIEVHLLLNTRGIPEEEQALLQKNVDAYYLAKDRSNNSFAEKSRAKRWFKKLSRKNSSKVAQQIAKELKRKKNSTKAWLCNDRMIAQTEHLARELRPDIVIAEYIFTAPLLRFFPKTTLKMIDTHDCFSCKQDQVLCYGAEEKLSCTKKEERQYLMNGDVVIAIQPNEAAIFRKLVPERQVVTVGMDFEPIVEFCEGESKPVDTILAVGGDNPINIHGMREFIEKSWPQIRQCNPEVTLRIVGSLGTAIDGSDSRVVRTGIVENLDDEYKNATVVINPIIAGTGLKVKTVEALRYGKPLMVFPNGADGVEYEGDPPFVVCNSWEDFSRRTNELLQDQPARAKLGRTAIEYVSSHLETDRVFQELREILESRFLAVAGVFRV